MKMEQVDENFKVSYATWKKLRTVFKINNIDPRILANYRAHTFHRSFIVHEMIFTNTKKSLLIIINIF